MPSYPTKKVAMPDRDMPPRFHPLVAKLAIAGIKVIPAKRGDEDCWAAVLTTAVGNQEFLDLDDLNDPIRMCRLWVKKIDMEEGTFMASRSAL